MLVDACNDSFSRPHASHVQVVLLAIGISLQFAFDPPGPALYLAVHSSPDAPLAGVGARTRVLQLSFVLPPHYPLLTKARSPGSGGGGGSSRR